MQTRNLFFVGLLALVAPACGAPDELANDVIESDQIDEGKADSLSSTSTYYSLRQDLRRCLYPLCGGNWVSRVNQSYTQCVDGSWAKECYVAEIDYKALKISDEQVQNLRGSTGKLLVRGKIKKLTVSTFQTAQLVASEAWLASSDNAPTGIFYRVKDSGVRCITFPCPSYHEAKLNSTVSRNIAALDLSKTGASDDAIGEAYTAATQPGGVLVVGKHTTITGPAGNGLSLEGSQFYTKVLPKASCGPVCAIFCLYGNVKDANGCDTCSCNPPPAKTCYVGGCSGQVCSDQQGVITTCLWKPEYACYQNAKCDVQADGNCGWTKTAELTACLGN